MTRLVPYVEERLRRPIPAGIPVVPGSTPVLAFGDPTRAWVATLALNPSSSEFRKPSGEPLAGEDRRLVDLLHLGLVNLVEADESQLRDVIDGCDGYFQRHPYMRYFTPLDQLVERAFGASYGDGSACHLDLSQWATDPLWSRLTASQRNLLMTTDGAFLAQQLEQENITVLLLNGMGVIKAVTAAGLFELEQVMSVSNTRGTLTCNIFRGAVSSTRVYGWNVNLQGSFGVDQHLKTELALALRLLESSTTATTRGDSVDGSIPEKTAVTSKTDLANLLRAWHQRTDEPTIGDVKQFGGRAYVHVQLGEIRVALNADTKRAAVERYLQAVDTQGAELPWQVVAGGKGTLNKVIYEGMETSAGWYAYTTTELEAPRWL